MNSPKPLPAAAVAAGEEGRSIASTLGAVLRRARADRGITQKDLANRLLVHVETVQRMESGDPSVQLGFYLGAAKFVGVPLTSVEVDKDLAARALAITAKPRSRRTRQDFFS